MQINCPIHATTVTASDGKRFHPAVCGNGPLDRPHYWENVTFETEQEAYEWACETVADFYVEVSKLVGEWNVFEI